MGKWYNHMNIKNTKKGEFMSVNKVMVLGRLGKDPELKHTPSGQAVCNFSIATSEKYKKKDGSQEEKTEWHNIVVWGKLAEICNQYLKKGSQAFVEGKLSTRSWEKDGVKRYSTETIANNVQFIGGKNDSGDSSKPSPVESDSNFSSDDIPF